MTGAERFNELLKRDKTHPKDLERQSLFYILAYSNDGDLFKKVNHIYDFEENCIKLECLEGSVVDLCGSAVALIRLGFNLFNGYSEGRSDVLSVLCGLDNTNYEIAKKAIDIRFNKVPFTYDEGDSE